MSISSVLTGSILSIFTFVASFMTPSYVAPVPEMKQDDFIPVMRFVATSDTHIEKLGDTGCKRLSATLRRNVRKSLASDRSVTSDSALIVL